MLNEPFGYDYRIVSITSTSDAQLVSKLIADRLATLTKTLPTSKSVVRVALTPGASIELRCADYNTDALTLASGTRYVFDLLNGHDLMTVKNAGAIVVELYFGR